MRSATEKFYAFSVRGASLLQIALLASVAGVLYWNARPAISHFGLSFFSNSSWNPVTDTYGALVFILGTLVTSLIALIIAVPLSVASAIFITQFVPKKLASTLAFLVSLLAAVPSIIYGLWGVFVLIPFLRKIFATSFEFPFYGVSIFSAGVLLAIMIIPTITSLSRELFRATQEIYRESALALGSTRWEAIKLGVIGISWRGIAGASLLGLGRAIGETMAVTMVIGNANRFPILAAENPIKYIFSPSNTMSSLIANEYGEAMAGSIHLSSLFLVGLGLLAVSITTNAIARSIVSERTIYKLKRKAKKR